MLELIKKHGADGVFQPDDTAILVAAFDEAWAYLAKSGVHLSSERRIEEARNTLAKFIIQEALAGERDQHRLRESALLHYTKSQLRDAPR